MKGDTTPPAEDIVDGRMGEIEARFGERLTAEQLEQVRSRTVKAVQLGAALRAMPLSNADEPDIVFMPAGGREAH